ncbi:MAG: hypothetical protein P8Y18_09995, partial [Candidatus Bathyarchaeota archaeon]
MQKYKVISAKIPEQLYQEFALRIPEGKRSVFIRKAIREKLEKTPRPNKLLALEQKIAHLQKDMNKIKDNLTKLEILTHEQGKINPNIFCTDEIDTKIIHYLLDYRGATTTELADVLKTNRWLILNRLRKISKASKKQLGNPIVIYYPGERAGKRKAW